MRNIRVLLASDRPSDCGAVRELLDHQPGFELVGEEADPVALLLAVKRTRADVVVLGSEDAGESGLNTHLLSEYPHLTLLILAGRTLFIEQLCPRRVRILEASSTDVTAALRRAVRVPCES